MSNFRIYPVRGDDPRFLGFAEYDKENAAAYSFTKISGAGTVAYNASGDSVIGKGSFEFTGTGVWAVNTLLPVSYDAGVKGTIHIKISSGSATVNVGYESFDKDSAAITLSPTQNNFLINGTPAITSPSYMQFMNVARGEGVSPNTLPTGTRFVRPRIEIVASTGTVSIDAFILNQFLDDAMPTGVVHAYGGTSIPSGYLLCDGAEVNRTTYARLFAAIGTAYGAGNGSTTFRIPDFRGYFLRGVDGAAGRDTLAASRTEMNAGGNTGNNVGSVQTGGSLNLSSQGHYTTFSPNLENQNFQSVVIGYGGGEVRPVNAYVNYIIKY